MIPTKYVVVDIETTGFSFQNDRIIEIAAIHYEDGKRIDHFHTMVNPGISIPADIVSLTGITQADVIGAPTIEEIKYEFLSFIGDMTIIGHNVFTFDIPFLSAQMAVSIQNTVIDTLLLARDAFRPLPRHKLEYLNKVLNLGSIGSHRALNDAETTNALLWACQSPQKFDLLVQRALMDCEAEHMDPEHCNKNKGKPRFSPRIDHKAIIPSCGCTDSSSPLCGKVVVFTGTLSIPRETAMQMAVDAGAILKGSVTQKTNYLVVGSQDISLVGFDGMSTKEEKAHALNASGKTRIQIISEQDFWALLEHDDHLTREETDMNVNTPEERKAFELIYPELKSIIFEAPIDSSILVFQELGNCSSVYFMDSNELFFRIRIRKKSRYILIPEAFEDTLPMGTVTSRTVSDAGMLRIAIQDYEDILKYSDTLKNILIRLCRRHRDFGCCSRYEECSDARTCLHPDPKFALKCWYQQNLLEGKIFYGKNKTTM